MSAAVHWRSTSPTRTRAFGRALGDLLQAGDVVALCGPLGSGKTQLVKGLAAGLLVPADEPVVSPTFVLVREYRGRLKLYHVDAYRLGSSDELLSLGLEEMWSDPHGVVAIEWADRFPDALPAHTLWIELAHAGARTRELTLRIGDLQRRTTLLEAVAALPARRGQHPGAFPGISG